MQRELDCEYRPNGKLGRCVKDVRGGQSGGAAVRWGYGLYFLLSETTTIMSLMRRLCIYFFYQTLLCYVMGWGIGRLGWLVGDTYLPLRNNIQYI